ncbi:hypothetical protein NSP_8530 [Nodularia spumigena CCY9414]|nr:hypothetical protein NSP_8530 [Nodularia spumigena CCY9414]
MKAEVKSQKSKIKNLIQDGEPVGLCYLRLAVQEIGEMRENFSSLFRQSDKIG